jgi:glucose dehydrogenase
MKRLAATAAGLAVVALLPIAGNGVGTPQQAAPAPHTTWRDYGGGPDSSKFVAMNQITKANVGRLQLAWFYPTGDTLNYQMNPIIVDNVMYVLAKNNSLVALNATTGEEIWIHANLRGIARRGVNYWESPDRSDRRILFQMNNYLQAIDARTGKSILMKQGLGRDGSTVRAQSSTPGKIFENLILLGSAVGEGYMSPPGHVRAFDVVTGKLVWTFHTIPQPGEFGYDTWPKDAYKYHAASPIFRSARRLTTTTAPIASAPICSATACSRWTRAPASASGTIRPFTTTSGTTTSPPRRSSSPSAATAGRSTRSRRRPSRASCSSSTA